MESTERIAPIAKSQLPQSLQDLWIVSPIPQRAHLGTLHGQDGLIKLRRRPGLTEEEAVILVFRPRHQRGSYKMRGPARDALAMDDIEIARGIPRMR